MLFAIPFRGNPLREIAQRGAAYAAVSEGLDHFRKRQGPSASSMLALAASAHSQPLHPSCRHQNKANSTSPLHRHPPKGHDASLESLRAVNGKNFLTGIGIFIAHWR
jgi:hypothetical protein